MRGGVKRANGRGKAMNRALVAGVLSLTMGAGISPLMAEQPDPPGAAALPPGVALTSPSMEIPQPQAPAYTPVPPGALTQSLPAPAPMTDNAGMGTSDTPRAAAPRPVASGIDAAGNGASASQVAAPAVAPAADAPAMAAPAAPALANGTGNAAQPAAPATAQAPAGVPASGTVPAMAASPAVQPAPVAAGAVSAASAPEVAVTPVDPLAPVSSEVTALLVHPDTFTPSKKDQQGLVAFYAAGEGKPVFVDLKGFTPRGEQVLARLAAADEDGLDPSDYATPTLAPGADAQALARAELQLAAAALTYARQAQAGRFEPTRISSQVTPLRQFPDPQGVMETLAQASDADTALQNFNPPHAGYKALRAKLAEVSNKTNPVVERIDAGPLLRPGDSDRRVPALRTRLGATGSAGDTIYDVSLEEAVKAFQESSGLQPDGVIGPSTLAALNKDAGTGGGSTKADVIANMERWRWLPRSLGEQYVMVNIPEYMTRVFDDGKEVFETRTVVGKPATPTPLLTHDMEYVVVNPAWNIPPSIARNEMMPLLRNDPDRLRRMGIQVIQNRNGGISFRQPPGERNALGRIKFMFPNDHSVYLHDTPARALFANSRRAYSHGCMRLQDPLMFGEVIFGIGLPDAGLTKARIGKMIGGSERYINLKHHIPVHVVYFNAFVDDAGKVEVREDIYGINARVKSMLGLDGRRHVADGTATRKR